MKLRFTNRQVLTCIECNSMMLDMIGDVLICVDCKNARAIR